MTVMLQLKKDSTELQCAGGEDKIFLFPKNILKRNKTFHYFF